MSSKWSIHKHNLYDSGRWKEVCAHSCAAAAHKYPTERSTQIGEGHNWGRPFRIHVPYKPEDDLDVELTGVHICDIWLPKTSLQQQFKAWLAMHLWSRKWGILFIIHFTVSKRQFPYAESITNASRNYRRNLRTLWIVKRLCVKNCTNCECKGWPHNEGTLTHELILQHYLHCLEALSHPKSLTYQHTSVNWLDLLCSGAQKLEGSVIYKRYDCE